MSLLDEVREAHKEFRHLTPSTEGQVYALLPVEARDALVEAIEACEKAIRNSAARGESWEAARAALERLRR